MKNDELGQVRTITKDGEPWFVAKDITDVLELKSAKDSTKYLYDDEKDKMRIKHSGSDYKSEMIIVSESGLYSLILRSRKPQAKSFKKGITSEVLPMIRKTGGYVKGVISNDTLGGR